MTHTHKTRSPCLLHSSERRQLTRKYVFKVDAMKTEKTEQRERGREALSSRVVAVALSEQDTGKEQGGG